MVGAGVVARTALESSRRGRPRPGHSLPELMVAVTFLATTVTAVGASSVLGAQWSARAVMRQEAARVGAAVLDSVAGAGVGAGEWVRDDLRVRWSSADGVIRVEVFPVGGEQRLVALEGAPIPAAPVLPDHGHEAVEGAAW